MRKSVAEQLAELATPAPAADPEAADALDDAPGLFDSDEELAAPTARPSKHAPEKRQRHASIDLDSAAYRGRKTSRQDIFNDGTPSVSDSSGNDSDGPEPQNPPQTDAAQPNIRASHGNSKRGEHSQPKASRARSAMAEIAEDEWGSDVSEDNGGGMLEELGADEWGSDDADANREGSSEDDADEDEEDAPARPNKATEQQPNRGRGLPADAAGDARGTGSEEESDPSSENNDDDDMSSGDEEAGMDMDEAGASDEDDDDEEGDDKGWAQLEADFATIQAAPATAKPPAPASSQAAKAASVANQVKLWEKALGVRITLQRGLIAADRLPRSAAHACALATVDGAAAEVAAAKREAAAVLGECMDAMHELLARTVEDGGPPAGEAPGAQIAEAASASASAAGEAVGDVCGAAWPLIEALEERFKPFRNEEIDRWHRRTLLASGQVAMRGGGGLQALNQPMSHQVSELLRNPDRALARTQRRRQAHDRVLCEPSAAASGAAAGPDSEDEEGTEEGAAQPGGGDPAEAGGAAERDVESYDDSAFYQVLLHEFLEAAETDGRVSGVAQVAKARKVVDRRASKGRKVRYHVMQKLVNFMAPVEDTYPVADDRVSALFTNLFGHKSRA